MKFYSVIRWIARYLVVWIFPVRLVGSPYINDGSLICANHISDWDPIFIAAMLKSKIHFMAKAELFKFPPAAYFLRKLNVFPVDRKNNDVGAIREAIRVLKNKNSLLIFPEGTRIRGSKPDKANLKAGAGFIASMTGVDIVPVAIYNKGYKTRLFKPTYVIVGNPIKKAEYMDYSGGDRMKIAEYIFLKINEEIERFESKKLLR